ncbi:hypothetical protein IAR55_001184 [Kwoniella newhampshirensis]|uniref:Uncharacterized protein n=1 Tax=Kwoniella newhampshirensis TaxID=1651941 RepID=A0AAW0Z554_9TREE
MGDIREQGLPSGGPNDHYTASTPSSPREDVPKVLARNSACHQCRNAMARNLSVRIAQDLDFRHCHDGGPVQRMVVRSMVRDRRMREDSYAYATERESKESSKGKADQAAVYLVSVNSSWIELMGVRCAGEGPLFEMTRDVGSGTVDSGTTSNTVFTPETVGTSAYVAGSSAEASKTTTASPAYMDPNAQDGWDISSFSFDINTVAGLFETTGAMFDGADFTMS